MCWWHVLSRQCWAVLGAMPRYHIAGAAGQCWALCRVTTSLVPLVRLCQAAARPMLLPLPKRDLLRIVSHPALPLNCSV